jgi:hypothetical protein
MAGGWRTTRIDPDRNEVYVQPFHPDDPSAPSPEFVISKGGAIGMPRWRADGKEIYYLSRDNKFMAVEILDLPVVPRRRTEDALPRVHRGS